MKSIKEFASTFPKLAIVMLIVSLTFAACSDKKTEAEKETNDVAQAVEENLTDNFDKHIDDNPTDSDCSGSSSDDCDSKCSVDMDSWLNNYEKFVDTYVKTMKKAAKGDLTIMAELPNLLSQAEEMDKKLGNSQGDMSPAQLKRFMAIQTKMLGAVTEAGSISVNPDKIVKDAEKAAEKMQKDAEKMMKGLGF